MKILSQSVSKPERCGLSGVSNIWQAACACCLILIVFSGISARGGDNFDTIFNFPYVAGVGEGPYCSLTLLGNTLYGTTAGSASPAQGTIFSVGTDGSSPTWMHKFQGVGAGPDGAYPESGLVSSPDGQWLYGTTVLGGQYNKGVVFAISINDNGTDPAGTYTVLHSFGGTVNINGQNVTDGYGPAARLIISPDGSTLYGTTVALAFGGGAIFAVSISGESSTTMPTASGYTMIPFPSVSRETSPPYGNTVGAFPVGDLTLSPNGNWLFGTASVGGQYGYGTVFAVATSQINPSGSFLLLYSFTGTAQDTFSAFPCAGLMLSGNTLYGTTSGKPIGTPGPSSPSPNGTVFALNFQTDISGNPQANTGSIAWVHALPGSGPYVSSQGDLCWEYIPTASSVGTLLGTTSGNIYSGGQDPGSVFEIAADGSHLDNMLLPHVPGSSSPYPVGISPMAGVTPGQPPAGKAGWNSFYSYDFYGATYYGGSTYGKGTVLGVGAIFDLNFWGRLRIVGHQVRWTDPANVVLQAAPALTGPWTNVTGTPPYTFDPLAEPQQYFRLSVNATNMETLAPVATTLPASDITATTATLNGDVVPNGANTTVWFQYGATTNYGNVTPSVLVSIPGGMVVSSMVSGLTESVTNHYQLIATNSMGMVFGQDASFVTP